jgi:hypothetical protein
MTIGFNFKLGIFYKKAPTRPPPKRTYLFLNETHKDRAKWRWDDKGTVAQTAVEALEQKFLGSLRVNNWVQMDYEVLWCLESNEKIYIKTEYGDDCHNFILLNAPPEDIPKKLTPKPQSAISKP